MHRFAEQRGVMAAVVQAHHVEAIDGRAFQQVHRRRRLPEAPEMGERQAQYAAEQHAVHRVVRDDQQRVVVAEALAGACERRPRPVEHVLQRFAARHQHVVRRVAPGGEALAVARADLAGEQALPFAVRDLHQAGIGAEHRRTFAERDLGGAPRTRQRRCDGAHDRHVGQALRERGGLRFADRRQRDVLLSLVAAFGVPGRFAVAGEDDLHARALRPAGWRTRPASRAAARAGRRRSRDRW